jgi:hypothetical protein
MEPGIDLSFLVNKRVEILMKCSWRYICGARGITYHRSPIGIGNYSQSGEAGAGLSVLNTGLSLKIRF